jgi:toluene monooxygenase system ferredoxin subunit
MRFLELLKESELWVGELRQVRVERTRVLLLRTDAGVFAYADRCPHLGVPLSTGTLEGSTLTCAAHQFQFEASTGEGINPSCLRLHPFPVQCKDGGIWVDLSRPVAAPLLDQNDAEAKSDL